MQPRSLISAFVVHCLDSLIPLVSKSEISSLYLASVAAKPCLTLLWSQILNTRISRDVAQFVQLSHLTRKPPFRVMRPGKTQTNLEF